MSAVVKKAVEPRRQSRWSLALLTALWLSGGVLATAWYLGCPWVFGPGQMASDMASQQQTPAKHHIRF